MSRQQRVERSHQVSTSDGWLLDVKQTFIPSRLDTTLRPLIIIPGYGMNTFIFGFHPRGTPMEQIFAEAGFEVWSANLRAQGGSTRLADAGRPSLRSCAEIDIPAVINAVLEATQTSAERADLIGCSLGGSFAYAHLALHRAEHRVGRLIAIGAPLRWDVIHPLFKLAFRSPTIAGMIRFSGTRRLAQVVFPILLKFPKLLSIYMNTEYVDLEHAQKFTNIVEDPQPRINKDIARWMRARDMTLRGVNITEALTHIDTPLLVVVANRDGIVPPAVALSVLPAWGGDDVHVLEVGDDKQWYAHADLFIGDDAPDHVFQPLINWLSLS